MGDQTSSKVTIKTCKGCKQAEAIRKLEEEVQQLRQEKAARDEDTLQARTAFRIYSSLRKDLLTRIATRSSRISFQTEQALPRDLANHLEGEIGWLAGLRQIVLLYRLEGEEDGQDPVSR